MRIKLLNKNAVVPFKTTEGSAGYDICAAIEEPVEIAPGETVKIPTGFATELDEPLFGAIYARSGLATNQGLRLANCVAIIDSDYRGEWFIPLYNDSNETRTVEPGDRIAQVIFNNCYRGQFEVVPELHETERGEGGFGSTGV